MLDLINIYLEIYQYVTSEGKAKNKVGFLVELTRRELQFSRVYEVFPSYSDSYSIVKTWKSDYWLNVH